MGGSFSEDFFGRIFGKIVFGEILWYEFFVLFFCRRKLISLSRFWFLSSFCLKAEGRKEGKNFDP